MNEIEVSRLRLRCGDVVCDVEGDARSTSMVYTTKSVQRR